MTVVKYSLIIQIACASGRGEKKQLRARSPAETEQSSGHVLQRPRAEEVTVLVVDEHQRRVGEEEQQQVVCQVVNGTHLH